MTSSFMSLPDEIKLNILDSVNIGPENTHLELRRTHPWFRANICTETLRARLLAAEKDPKLVPPRHRVCYTCLRVLPADNFADNSTRTPKGLGGKQAHKRFCIDCGVRYGKYSPGSEVMVRGKPGFVCVCCRKLQRGEEGEKHRKKGRGPNYAKRVEARRQYIVPREPRFRTFISTLLGLTEC